MMCMVVSMMMPDTASVLKTPDCLMMDDAGRVARIINHTAFLTAYTFLFKALSGIFEK